MATKKKAKKKETLTNRLRDDTRKGRDLTSLSGEAPLERRFRLGNWAIGNWQLALVARTAFLVWLTASCECPSSDLKFCIATSPSVSQLLNAASALGGGREEEI